MIDSIEFVGRCSLRQRSLLPSASGIYFVSDERDNLLYIGQATDLRSRWAGKGHHRYQQFARKGLDKITLSYILAPVTELDTLERQYIQALKPSENDGRVKDYLPKKSSRLSELQRILKLVNKPLFSYPIRGFVAGMYISNSVPHIVLVCQQNMGEILGRSSTHRTKKRFYLGESAAVKVRGIVFYGKPIWKFDARRAVFEFVEFFTLGEELFEKVYPHLSECQILSVKLRKLNDTALLKPILQALPTDRDRSAQDYLYPVCEHLQPLSPDFALDEKALW